MFCCSFLRCLEFIYFAREVVIKLQVQYLQANLIFDPYLRYSLRFYENRISGRSSAPSELHFIAMIIGKCFVVLFEMLSVYYFCKGGCDKITSAISSSKSDL